MDYFDYDDQERVAIVIQLMDNDYSKYRRKQKSKRNRLAAAAIVFAVVVWTAIILAGVA